MSGTQIDEYRKPAALQLEQSRVICNKCMHCGENDFSQSLCLNAQTGIDYVDGRRRFRLCRDINSNGLCRDFVQKPTFIERVVKFLKFWRWGE